MTPIGVGEEGTGAHRRAPRSRINVDSTVGGAALQGARHLAVRRVGRNAGVDRAAVARGVRDRELDLAGPGGDRVRERLRAARAVARTAELEEERAGRVVDGAARTPGPRPPSRRRAPRRGGSAAAFASGPSNAAKSKLAIFSASSTFIATQTEPSSPPRQITLTTAGTTPSGVSARASAVARFCAGCHGAWQRRTGERKEGTDGERRRAGRARASRDLRVGRAPRVYCDPGRSGGSRAGSAARRRRLAPSRGAARRRDDGLRRARRRRGSAPTIRSTRAPSISPPTPTALVVECDLCLIAPVAGARARARGSRRGPACRRSASSWACIHTHAGPDTGFGALLAGREPPAHVAALFDAVVDAAWRRSRAPRRRASASARAALAVGREPAPRRRAARPRGARAARRPRRRPAARDRVGPRLPPDRARPREPALLGRLARRREPRDRGGAPGRARALRARRARRRRPADARPSRPRRAGPERRRRLRRRARRSAARRGARCADAAGRDRDAPRRRGRRGVGARRARDRGGRRKRRAPRRSRRSISRPTRRSARASSTRWSARAPSSTRSRSGASGSRGCAGYLRDRTAARFAFGAAPEVEVQVLRLGDALLLALPLEATTDVGLAWKARAAAPHAALVSIANGWMRYLPHGRNFVEPDAHAEVRDPAVDLRRRRGRAPDRRRPRRSQRASRERRARSGIADLLRAGPRPAAPPRWRAGCARRATRRACRFSR